MTQFITGPFHNKCYDVLLDSSELWKSKWHGNNCHLIWHILQLVVTTMALLILVLCIKSDATFFVDAKGILIQNSTEPNLTVMGVSLPRRSCLLRSVARGPSSHSGSRQPAPPYIRHPPSPPPPPSSATRNLRSTDQLAQLQPPFTACAAPMWVLPLLVGSSCCHLQTI